MIGLDTNIIIRLLVQDDTAQTRQVADWLQQNSDVRAPHFISDLVLAETVWVLKQAYGFSREEIAEALLDMFLNTIFQFERDDAKQFQIFQTFAQQSLDLSDILIATKGAEQGCTATISFDRNAIRAGVMSDIASVKT